MGNMGDLVRCWLLIERRPAMAASGYFTLLRCFGAIGSWGLALVPGRVYIAKVGVLEEVSNFSVAFTIHRFGRVAQLVRALA